MKVNWKEIWDANPDMFVVSGWEECPEDKRKCWHLPPQFRYFNAGDLNLRVGIVASQGIYKEEEFLLGGILWGSRLGNGIRTVIYFVAPEFSPVFLGAIAKIGGNLSLKSIYWREKLTPSLYPVPEKVYRRTTLQIDSDGLTPGWDFWERQLNPVALNHLKIVKNYFEGLTKRRVRTRIEKNKIAFCWGNIEIAEVKKKGNKFELATKVKWTRNKSISTKFLKSGWVDCSGIINDEFCRAINGILELLENMEMNGSLETKELLAVKLINDKEFVSSYFGKHLEFPWILKDRNESIDISKLYFFSAKDQINIVCPILDKPLQKLVNTLLVFTALEYSCFNEKKLSNEPDIRWNNKIVLLISASLKDEIRLCQSWLKDPENYPIILLPEDWKTEGFKRLKGLILLEYDDSFSEYH